MSTIIHENGITLSERQRNYLRECSWSLNKQMRKILKNKYPAGATYYEMKCILEDAHGKQMNIDTVRRGLSQQTDITSRLKQLEDDYGRMPLVKSDDRRLNPESGAKISVYRYNQRYGKPPTHKELLERNKDNNQMTFQRGFGI